MKSKPLGADQPTMLNAVFAATWVADTVLTLMFTGMHGVAAEANPIMRWVLVELGVMGFVGIKAATLGLWLSVSQYAPRWISWALVVIMLPVVYLGFQMLFIPI